MPPKKGEKWNNYLNFLLTSRKLFFRSIAAPQLSPGLANSAIDEPVNLAITAALVSPGLARRLISSSVNCCLRFGWFFKPNWNWKWVTVRPHFLCPYLNHRFECLLISSTAGSITRFLRSPKRLYLSPTWNCRFSHSTSISSSPAELHCTNNSCRRIEYTLSNLVTYCSLYLVNSLVSWDK